MAVITSAGTGDSNAGGTWTGGSVPTAGDDAEIQSGHTVTLNATHTWNSLVLNGSLDGDNNELTIDSERAGAAVELDGAIVGTDTDITIITPAATNLDLLPTSGNLRNLTINHASCVATLYGATTLTGDLTITAGTLSTGSDNALTVTGATSIGDGSAAADTATLTCHASPISLGSGYSTTWGLQIERGGTFVGGSGAHTFGSFKLGAAHADVKCTLTSGVTTIDDEKTGDNYTIYLQDSTFDDANGTVTITHNGDARFQLGGEPLHNVIINHADCSMQMSSDAVINGDLTITAGEFKGSYGGTHYDLTVGSLTIASGATYNATSGTTTIKNETSDYAFKNDGTFTHNKGEVFIDGNTDDVANTEIQSDDFYDLRMDAQTTNHEVKWSDKSGNALTIYNNLTITQGSFEGKDAGDTLTIHGLTNIGATGKFGADANQTGQITHHGLVTNLGTYFINDTTTVKMNGGFRQLNALTIS